MQQPLFHRLDLVAIGANLLEMTLQRHLHRRISDLRCLVVVGLDSVGTFCSPCQVVKVGFIANHMATAVLYQLHTLAQ
jgi:hypothetical protein